MPSASILALLVLVCSCSRGGRTTTSDLALTNASLLGTTVVAAGDSLEIGTQQSSLQRVEATLDVGTDDSFVPIPYGPSLAVRIAWRGTLTASANGALVYLDADEGYRYVWFSGNRSAAGDAEGPRTFVWRYSEHANGYTLDGTPNFNYWGASPLKIEMVQDVGDTVHVLRYSRR